MTLCTELTSDSDSFGLKVTIKLRYYQKFSLKETFEKSRCVCAATTHNKQGIVQYNCSLKVEKLRFAHFISQVVSV